MTTKRISPATISLDPRRAAVRVGATPAVTNPPVPGGWKYMVQSDVTPEMTAWAVAILNDPTTYPMFACTTRYFDGFKWTLARVEHHSNASRGVSLFKPSTAPWSW